MANAVKVLLQANVPNVGIIGDVVQVKAGYARNYLIPQGLAVEPTPGNLKRIEAEKQAYLERVAKEKAEVQARARGIDGKEITIAARANPEGNLYGSVGPAQIVEALAKESIHVEERNVRIGQPIRRLDKHEITLDLGHEVTATIQVWVVPIHEPGQEGEAQPAEPAEAEGGAEE